MDPERDIGEMNRNVKGTNLFALLTVEIMFLNLKYMVWARCHDMCRGCILRVVSPYGFKFRSR